MTSLSVKSLIAGAALLAAPVALAGINTSAQAFDAKITAARTSGSPGGTTVIRSEMSAALNEFFYDDWMVDGDEHDYLGEQLTDPYWTPGVDASAMDLGWDFYELNDGMWAAEVDFELVTTPAAQLYGASGPLATASKIAEGWLTSQGTANQDTLLYSYYGVLAVGYEDVYFFSPITSAEMVQMLSQRTLYGVPPQAQVNGAASYLLDAAGEEVRLYSSGWSSYYWGGQSGGYVIAAVGDGQDFIRMVRVITWGD